MPLARGDSVKDGHPAATRGRQSSAKPLSRTHGGLLFTTTFSVPGELHSRKHPISIETLARGAEVAFSRAFVTHLTSGSQALENARR
jgi:hypothetical protein